MQVVGSERVCYVHLFITNISITRRRKLCEWNAVRVFMLILSMQVMTASLSDRVELISIQSLYLVGRKALKHLLERLVREEEPAYVGWVTQYII